MENLNLNLNHLSGTDRSQIVSTAAFAVNSGSSSAPTSNPRELGVDAHRGSWFPRYDANQMLAFPPSNSSYRWAQPAVVVRRSDENNSDGDLMAVVSGSVRPSLSDQADDRQERMRRRQHSLSMAGNEEHAPFVGKKFMSVQELEELDQTDPMRAGRIRANRQSAAKSRERKMRYMNELEKKLKALEVQDSTFCAQFAMFKSDVEGMSTKNKELRLHLQSMKEQLQLHDDLNNALREEVRCLKIMTGQLPSGC